MGHRIERLRQWALRKLAGDRGVAINLKMVGVQIALQSYDKPCLLILHCAIESGDDYQNPAYIRVLRPDEVAHT